MNLTLARALVAGGLAFAAAALPAATTRLHLAPDDTDAKSIENFLGRPVYGVNREELGETRDFLADARTSRLAFAVVASGGVLGIGEVLRLAPIAALTPEQDRRAFALNVGAQWQQMRTVGEEELAAGRIAAEGAGSARMERKPDAGATQAPGGSGLRQRLIRLADLPGRNVTAGELDVCDIEDIVLDFAAGSAQVLLDPEREFAGAGKKVLAPLAEFVFGGRGGLIATRLTRADFNDLRPSWNQTTGPKEPPSVAERHRELHYGTPVLEETSDPAKPVPR